MGTQGVLCPACGAVAAFDARECPNCLTSLSPSMERTQVRGSPKPRPLDDAGATLVREDAPSRTLDDDSQSAATRRMPALPRKPEPAAARTLAVDDALAPDQTVVGEDSDPDLLPGTDPRVPTPQLPDLPPTAVAPRRAASGTMSMPVRGPAPGGSPGAEGLDAAPRRDPLIGQKLGEYVIEERIGIGGMSTVYRARQPRIGKDVAVKVLRTDVIADARDMEQLLNEARTVNAIHHPGIINIFDAGELPDGRQYLVMEYLDGESLEERMERAPRLTLAEALPILEDTMAALTAAHNAGVVHRDLKPANVFLVKQPDGKPWVKLLDFGLARPTARREVSRVAGTPDYISPEHARGRPPGPPADVYALGVLAFQLATGRLPFTGTNAHEVMEKHVKVPPPVPRSIDSRIPDALSSLVLKMLDKEPGRRPDSAQVRAELRAIARLVGATSNTDVGRAPELAAPPPVGDSSPELVPRTQPTGLPPVPLPTPPPANPRLASQVHPGPPVLVPATGPTLPQVGSGPPPRATVTLSSDPAMVTQTGERRSVVALALLVLALVALAVALLWGPAWLEELRRPEESDRPTRFPPRVMREVEDNTLRSRTPGAPEVAERPPVREDPTPAALPPLPSPPAGLAGEADAGLEAQDAGAAPDAGEGEGDPAADAGAAPAP